MNPQALTVATVNWKGYFKRLRLEPGKRWLDLPLSACVTEGDSLQITDHGEVLVVCRKNDNAHLLPSYTAVELLQLGHLKIEVLIKEITDAAEYAAYRSLSSYHYRNHSIFGRTARLVARVDHPLYPRILGYIELATPLYMNKARTKLLDAPFASDDITWDRWDQATLQKYVHLIVRIARCVVYPEFRGLGLGQLLVQHAASFARTHWQMAGFRPCFLEISADMLKYVPFAERAKMVYIGDTEGNLGRVCKDLRYLMNNAARVQAGEIVDEDSCGIVDQQVARMECALRLLEEEKIDQSELLHRINGLTERAVLRDYAIFHELISLPKPTYIQGLNQQTVQFIADRVTVLAPQNGHEPPSFSLPPLTDPIRLVDATFTYTTQVRRTRQTHTIQQAFGISPSSIQTIAVQDLSLEIRPGQILFILGPSGSGKTTLIEYLSQSVKRPDGLSLTGEVALPPSYRPGILLPPRSQKALVEILGAGDVRAALYLMGLVGLSDAYIYLKRFRELSKGQQYRLMLAQLITENCNVWLADEFCANLDPVTANVVSHKFQQVARKLNATVIVAAPHCETFIHALHPDYVLQLTSTQEHRIWTGQEFLREIAEPTSLCSHFLHLRLLPETFRAVLMRKTSAIVRKGRVPFSSGPLLLESEEKHLLVTVIGVEHKKFGQLTESDAQCSGFASLAEFRSSILNEYSDLRDRTTITVIKVVTSTSYIK